MTPKHDPFFCIFWLSLRDTKNGRFSYVTKCFPQITAKITFHNQNIAYLTGYFTPYRSYVATGPWNIKSAEKIQFHSNFPKYDFKAPRFHWCTRNTNSMVRWWRKILGAHDKKTPISANTVPFWTQLYQIFLFYFLKRIPNIYTDFWYLDKKIRSKFHGPVPSHKIWPPIFLKFLQRQTLKGYKIKTDCENGWIYIRFKIQIWLQKIEKTL